MGGVGGGTSLCGFGVESWLEDGLAGAGILKKTVAEPGTGTVWKAADLSGGIEGCRPSGQ